MFRKGTRILWAVAFLLVASCSAKREALGPPPPSPPPPQSPAPASAPPAPRIEVVQLQMTADRDLVGVKIRVADKIDLNSQEIYMIDETTGEKYTVVRLQRIGRLAEFSVPGEKGIHHLLFRNRDGRLKVGKRVTIVIGKQRYERLVIRQ